MGLNHVQNAQQKSMGGFDRCQMEQPPHEITAISEKECIEFYKLTFFSVDAAERLK